MEHWGMNKTGKLENIQQEMIWIKVGNVGLAEKHWWTEAKMRKSDYGLPIRSIMDIMGYDYKEYG